eukprot:s720_g18.t1
MMPSLVCGAVAGGEKPKSEKARIRKGLVLLCATPGRLAYHLEHTATFVVRNIRCLVLDEADRLLDMGFEPQIRSIHKKILEAAKDLAEGENAESPTGAVQTLLVSATLVPAVQQLADFCLRPKAFWADAETHAKEEVAQTGTVAVGQELNFLAPSTLTQWYCVVPGKERLAALFAAILSRVGEKKSIIFFSTGASVDFHCDLLQDAAWPPRGGRMKSHDQPAIKKLQGRFVGLAKDAKLLKEEDDEEEEEDEEEAAEDVGDRQNEEKMFAKTKIFKLHGSLSKEERAGYIKDFLKVPGGVLLASDAASRGLDFPQIDWIIQYDPPQRTRSAGLLSGHLASRVAAHAALASRARSGFLASLKAYRSFPRELRASFPFGQLHLGHLATSFALREAPREVVQKNRYERTAGEAQEGPAGQRGPRGQHRHLKERRQQGTKGTKGSKGTGKGKASQKAFLLPHLRCAENLLHHEVPKDDQQWLEPFQTAVPGEGMAESALRAQKLLWPVSSDTVPAIPANTENHQVVSFQLGISSLPGKRGSTDPLPCQDCLSLTRYDEDILYVLCDGHGPFGHLVAFRVAQSLPWFLEQLLAAGHRSEEALVHAFPKVAEDVAEFAKAKYIDISSSGASCSVAFRHGDEVKVAWLGDTRVLVATVTETSRRVDLVTPAHTTEDPSDPFFPSFRTPTATASQGRKGAAARAEQWRQVGSGGAAMQAGELLAVRLFVPGERYPGLFVTRAFGDVAGQGLGLSSQPEIRKTSFERTPGVLLLGSGGFWEMLDDARPGEEALQLLTSCRLKECGPSFAAGKLAAEARSRWQQAAEDCSDDVSCILLHWMPDAPAQGGSRDGRGGLPTAPLGTHCVSAARSHANFELGPVLGHHEDLALTPDTSLCPKEFDRQLVSVEASSGSSGAWLREPISDNRISLKRLDAAGRIIKGHRTKAAYARILTGLAQALPTFQGGKRAQACFCSRRGVEPSKDCFSITQRAGRALYLVCNGFGPAGHMVSFRVAQSIPKFLFEATEEVPEQLVARAFHAAAAELSRFAAAHGDCDLSQSGASVAALLRQDDSVHLAWLGESRPDGLELSRAFGHSASKSTRPDLAKTSFDSTPGLVLLGSGQLFESMSGEDAVEVLQETPLTAAVAGTALNRLCDKWQRTWDGKKSLLCFLLFWPGEETRVESPKSLSPLSPAISPSRSAQAALLAGKARYLQAKPAQSGAVLRQAEIMVSGYSKHLQLCEACPEAPTPPQPASPKAEPYYCPNCGTLNPATARPFLAALGSAESEAISGPRIPSPAFAPAVPAPSLAAMGKRLDAAQRYALAAGSILTPQFAPVRPN